MDDKVIYTPEGHKITMVALDKLSGETIWRSESLQDTTAYVSSIMIKRGDKKIIATVIRNYLIGVDAENGNIF